MPARFRVNYCVVSEKLIARNMLSLDYFGHGKRRLTTQNIGTVLMNLSKAYDCIPHDLLIAKLEAYSLDETSLHLLIGNKEQNLVPVSVTGGIQFVGYPKD